MSTLVCLTCEEPPRLYKGKGVRPVYCESCYLARRRASYNKWVAQPGNKEKRAVYQRENSREYQKYWRLAKHYGLTPESYAALLDKYQHRCAICQATEKLCVDHDHRTGAIRGILCSPCNRAIGQLGDTLEGVSNALTYLMERA